MTHFYNSRDLDPEIRQGSVPEGCLSTDALRRIEGIVDQLATGHSPILGAEDLRSHAEVELFVAILRWLGAVNVEKSDFGLTVSITGPLATHLPQVLLLFLKHGFSAFEDWSRRHRTDPERICSLEFLHHLETQRIDFSRKAGFCPEVLCEIPVSFALIKAHSVARHKDVYLFELNKDWGRYGPPLIY